MAIRPIVTGDDPILHIKCEEVKKFDFELNSLISDLTDTLRASPNAVGLAAPQIRVKKRVAVVDVGDGLVVLINPEFLERSGSEITWEGCLSFPNRSEQVKRPTYVKVRSLDQQGRAQIFEASGLKARAFCHEMDHLDGIVFWELA